MQGIRLVEDGTGKVAGAEGAAQAGPSTQLDRVEGISCWSSDENVFRSLTANKMGGS